LPPKQRTKEKEGMSTWESKDQTPMGTEKRLDKEGHMMKIIERLQKDAQAHRADSRKLMRVRDQQGEFNLKMLKSLERIERKLEKESDSSKTESQDP
jgi:hypothetical protein